MNEEVEDMSENEEQNMMPDPSMKDDIFDAVMEETWGPVWKEEVPPGYLEQSSGIEQIFQNANARAIDETQEFGNAGDSQGARDDGTSEECAASENRSNDRGEADEYVHFHQDPFDALLGGIDAQLGENGSEAARTILTGNREAVVRAARRVEEDPTSEIKEEIGLAHRLMGDEKISEIAERESALEKQYRRTEERMNSGQLSQEVGEQDLLSIKYRQQRLNTRAGMCGEGMDWEDLGDISDDNAHLIADAADPEAREIRKAFRQLDEDEQREVLQRAVDAERLTLQQANWIWNYER